MRRLGRLIARLSAAGARRSGTDMIEITDLTVRFGGVTPLDGMSVDVRPAAPAG